MNDPFDRQLSIHRTALGALSYRQELLASNIANADTPNFKARDLDFKSALAGAVAGRDFAAASNVGSRAGVLATTSPRHLQGSSSGAAFAQSVQYRTEFQPNADGNTVNMDIERSAFAENAMRLDAVLTFIRGDIKDMQLAMSQ